MLSNELEVFPSVPCWRVFFAKKNRILGYSGHKTAEAIVSDFGKGGFGFNRAGAARALR